MHSAPKHHKNHEDPQQRLKTLSEDDPVRELPPCNEYLAKCFTLAGMCNTGGMGVTALDWQDIKAFSEQSSYELNGWESEMVIMMSRVYCGFSHEAKELSCTAPYNQAASNEDAMQRNRDKVNNQMLAMLKKGKG